MSVETSPVSPLRLVKSATSTSGFNAYVASHVSFDALVNTAIEVSEDYADWPEDEGFGSSDFTSALKSYIDRLISVAGLSGSLKTHFVPFLSVSPL